MLSNVDRAVGAKGKSSEHQELLALKSSRASSQQSTYGPTGSGTSQPLKSAALAQVTSSSWLCQPALSTSNITRYHEVTLKLPAELHFADHNLHQN